MKKDIKKKFFLAAMVASLALLWGGVTSCSNGSDDDKEETSVRLKGNFLISEDENADWIYCETPFTETESGIWTAEITAVSGWDKFGVEVNGIWYGAEDGLTDETDAKLVKDSPKNFWLATDKDGKSKVTVNLNKMTITVEAVSESSGGNVGSGGGNTGTGEETTTTLPTAVVLNNKIDGSNWQSTTMTKSEKDGIWTAELTLSNQWPNFNVKAIIKEQELWYKSESEKGTEAKLGTSVEITKDGKGDIWLDVGEANSNAKILVTVDFTKDAPTIKIETTE